VPAGDHAPSLDQTNRLPRSTGSCGHPWRAASSRHASSIRVAQPRVPAATGCHTRDVCRGAVSGNRGRGASDASTPAPTTLLCASGASTDWRPHCAHGCRAGSGTRIEAEPTHASPITHASARQLGRMGTLRHQPRQPLAACYPRWAQRPVPTQRRGRSTQCLQITGCRSVQAPARGRVCASSRMHRSSSLPVPGLRWLRAEKWGAAEFLR